MKQTITFSSYLFKILIIAVLFIALPMLFSLVENLSTTGSFIRSCLCFFTLLIISVRLLLGKEYVLFYSIAFISIILISTIHYLNFIDSSYFSSSGDAYGGFWHEYLTSFNEVEQLISERETGGLLYYDTTSFHTTHYEIWWIISFPFTFLGHQWLNYAPLNAFSSLLASVNLMLVYKITYQVSLGDNQSTQKLLLYSTAFFPLFILCDNFWRDAFGVAIISIGVTMVCLSRSMLGKVISTVLLATVSFLQRTTYMLIAGASVALKEVTIKKSGYRLILVSLFLVLFFIFVNIFQEYEEADYASGYINNMSFLALPIKILFGLIGPFPWWNFGRLVSVNPSFSFQLGDYAMGVFQLGFFFSLIFCWKSVSFKNLDYAAFLGFGIALSGILTRQMHIGYIAEGILFTLPWFFSQIGSKYKRYLLISFVSLVLLNIVVILLGNLGISQFWK